MDSNVKLNTAVVTRFCNAPHNATLGRQVDITSQRSASYPQVEGAHGILAVTGVPQPYLRLSPEEPIRANFDHFRQDRLFFAAVLDSGVKSLERRSLNQGVMTVGCLNRNNVHEGDAVAEPE